MSNTLTLAETSPVVRVDRSIRPSYPDWVKTVMHPEMEDKGPTEFDAAKIEQWLHPKQISGRISGSDVYDHLKSSDMLESCLGLRDLEEIQKKGIAFFRRYFKGKAVCAWKSASRFSGGNLGIPYLFECGGVVLVWTSAASVWYSRYPALRHAS